MCPVIIYGWFPSFCISNFIIRTKSFNFWRIFRTGQRFGMSTWNKVGRTKYTWQRRTTPIYIQIILQKNWKVVSHRNKYSKLQIDYLSLTSFGGFNTEIVLRRCGTCSIFSKSRCTQRRTSPLEISFSEHHDGSFTPRYSKPKVTRAWRGWILCFIQSKATASPLIPFCFKLAIISSNSGIWLVSRGFFSHSALWIGGPARMDGRLFPWFLT